LFIDFDFKRGGAIIYKKAKFQFFPMDNTPTPSPDTLDPTVNQILPLVYNLAPQGAKRYVTSRQYKNSESKNTQTERHTDNQNDKQTPLTL
jgi:hypothetical protein